MNRPRLGGRSDKRPVTPPALGRTTAWALAVWSAYIAAWAWASGSNPGVVVAWWLAGVCVVKAIAPKAAPPDAIDSDAVTGTEDVRLGMPPRDASGR
jgi:hypothetical protein